MCDYLSLKTYTDCIDPKHKIKYNWNGKEWIKA